MEYKVYIKISPKGLKYLGKTISENVEEYMGSGTVWKRHIKKYKYTFKDIQTQILYKTKNKEEFKNVCLYYSRLYDVANSPEWANIVLEEGDGGATVKNKRVINKDGKHKFIEHKNIEIYLKKGWNIGWNESFKKSQSVSKINSGQSSGEKNGMFNKKHNEDSIKKMSNSRIGKNKGENNPNSKTILQYTKDGQYVNKWTCMKSAALALNINYTSIWSVCNKITKHAGGYKWSYA